jgi:cell wall-associated NlpC family hydrolase
MGIAWVCFVAVWSARAQSAAIPDDTAPAARLLSAKQGRAIVKAAHALQTPARGTQDCSHVIHAVYQNAGFDYPYQSSFDLYAGAQAFARVKSPHAGDLVVWPGHVGIVVNPSHHSFYSLVRTGLEEQDYEGPYWRSRGTPRFYRYKLAAGNVVAAAQ